MTPQAARELLDVLYCHFCLDGRGWSGDDIIAFAAGVRELFDVAGRPEVYRSLVEEITQEPTT